MPTAGQIRAARALLGWTVATLSLRAGIGQALARQLELRGDGVRHRPEAALQAVRAAPEAAGVTFLDEDGQGGLGLRYRPVAGAADVVVRGRGAVG